MVAQAAASGVPFDAAAGVEPACIEGPEAMWIPDWDLVQVQARNSSRLWVQRH
ncbi:MAG: hypothetical protein QOE53_1280 [Pseudonocardiales bacterium]|jgi:hypothetical protein|nr:hypothetical protein [Pseudonocardiales bacterium]